MTGFRRLPIFWQTLALLLGGLVVAQAVAVLLIVYLPAPRPDFFTMSEIAEALAGEPRPGFMLEVHPAPVPRPDGMIESPPLTRRLAVDLDRPAGAVRLFFEPDQSEVFPFEQRTGRGAVPSRHGQPYFFNTVEAAARLADGRWRIVKTPARPWLSSWQRRTAWWFAISALAMLPVAFLFARALARPMRSFAAAVHRLDEDPDAPPVPEDGPAELRLAASALNRLQRNLHAFLRERSAMTAAIAHDLRTPLARIAFRIERAHPGVRDPVMGDVEQMRAMIASTIGFVRDGAGRGERKPVDLADLARRLAGHARDTGSAVTLGAIEPAIVSGDRSALERLLQNLVDNAVQYAGGAEIVLARADDSARLVVRDRGPGIAEAELERMFEPFARAEPSRSRSTGGIGLGLAIARSIVTAHEGAIAAANRPGGGLAVTVELPLGG